MILTTLKSIKKMKKMPKVLNAGFTLVELLIVIALIAILSVAVLATINPIEQTNKARDSKFKNNAAEVLGAYERYYASQYEYPWNAALAIGSTVPFGTRVAIGSTDPAFGVLGISGVGSSGVLITTSELKSSFMGTEPFASGVPAVDTLYVYHNGVDSNYVCYVPKANANRTGTVAAGLKCLALGTGANAHLYNLNTNGCLPMSSTNWTTPADLLPSAVRANVLCVPEGAVN